MPEVKFKRGESGAVAEDIFDDPELALHSKCVSIERTVQKGILPVDKALQMYQVPKAAYYSYLAKKHLDGIVNETNSDSVKDRVISTIGIMEAMISMSLTALSPRIIAGITTRLANFSKDVEKDKVTLK
jgi:hypothetical protein